MNIMNKNGLNLTFNFEKQNEVLLIHLQATNSTSIPINNFIFKAAVPKVSRQLRKNHLTIFVLY